MLWKMCFWRQGELTMELACASNDNKTDVHPEVEPAPAFMLPWVHWRRTWDSVLQLSLSPHPPISPSPTTTSFIIWVPQTTQRGYLFKSGQIISKMTSGPIISKITASIFVTTCRDTNAHESSTYSNNECYNIVPFILFFNDLKVSICFFNFVFLRYF